MISTGWGVVWAPPVAVVTGHRDGLISPVSMRRAPHSDPLPQEQLPLGVSGVRDLLRGDTMTNDPKWGEFDPDPKWGDVPESR